MKKYEKVMIDIIEKIQKEELLGKLPTEIELATKYDVSKNTIRTALSNLINDGYITSRHGSGYYVTTMSEVISNNILSLRSFGSLYKEQNVHTRVLGFQIIKADKTLANNLNITEDDLAYKIERLRFIDNNPTILENTFIPYHILPNLQVDDLNNSLYEYITEYTSSTIDYAIKEIHAIVTDDQISQILDVSCDKPIFKIINKGFLKSGVQYEYSENYHSNPVLQTIIRGK